MNLLNTLQALKKDKKKLIIAGLSAVFVLIIFNVSLVVLMSGSDENIPAIDNDAVDSIFADVIGSDLDSNLDSTKNERDSTIDRISALIELYGDSNQLLVHRDTDTCIVNSNLNVKIKNYTLKLSLTYFMHPYPEHDEAVRLVRLFNYRLGKILEENQMDKISIENFEKEFNMFLEFGVTEHPYNFRGDAKAKLHEFKLE